MSTTNEFAVETINLTKRFENIIAVNKVSLKIKTGEIFGLIGPNGAGKTTLIRLLVGLLVPDYGEGYILGRSIKEITPELKQRIGYMTQTKSLYPDLTARENIDFFARLCGVKDKNKRRKLIDYVLKLIEIEKWADMPVFELSGGTQQRTSLACAIVHNPDLLFLDEPTVGISPNLRKTFWEYFKKLTKEGKTIIVTTHYLDEAINCDRIAMMHDGKILALGTIPEIMSIIPYGKSMHIRTKEKLPEDIVSALEAKFDLKISKKEDNLNIIHYNDDGIVDDIIFFLKQNNVQIVSVETQRPSIDDVFIHLVNQRKIEEGDE